MQWSPLDFITPNEVAGIEVYQAKLGVPPEYAALSRCGAIVIWTRRGAATQ
jgi:hypothetical protein